MRLSKLQEFIMGVKARLTVARLPTSVNKDEDEHAIMLGCFHHRTHTEQDAARLIQLVRTAKAER